MNAENIEVAFTIASSVVGGLGIFLLGMKNMSEGMQAVAGAKLRALIGAITNNRFVACGVGTLVTCLIQSSSVTTVMVVGMVNASLMTLTQAIGVILGANIGTTITGWILVLKVGKYGLPILGVSAFAFLFSKREKVRYLASMFMGIGMVFFGLELMKHGFSPIKDMPEFREWFSHFTPHNYLGVLKCCLVGAILTAIVQSSSATLGITIGLATSGVIDFPTAAALVLGENIGTTITAWLASLGASTNAKRAAYAHIIINMTGVAWITMIFWPYLKVVGWLVGHDPSMMVVAEGGDQSFPHIAAGIAAVHTGFNVSNAAIMMPLIGVMTRVLKKLVPEKRREKPHLTYLDVRMFDTPAIGIQQSKRELVRMGEILERMLISLRNSLVTGHPDEVVKKKAFSRENTIDIIQKEIVVFLSHLLSGNVPQTVMTAGRRQLRMADEYESIGDYITNIFKLNLKLIDADLQMSGKGKEEILDLHDHVFSYFKMINHGVVNENTEILRKAEEQGVLITKLMKHYRSEHLERVESGEASAHKSLIYTDMLNAYRRIKDHSLNIAQTLGGEK
ncbi:MAG: Na/Pi cotransporter family protein [Sedimentisphaerales bacterium]|nr:Na/Pi cotransporter family protein [Sedimentisphaerales bacterium]